MNTSKIVDTKKLIFFETKNTKILLFLYTIKMDTISYYLLPRSQTLCNKR